MDEDDCYCHGTCPLHCRDAVEPVYGPMTREHDGRISRLNEVVARWIPRQDSDAFLARDLDALMAQAFIR